jgi:two-component system chemotaxis response regulator CheB
MESQIIVIGASLGGMDALKVILKALPKQFSLPMVIVQHRSKHSDEMLTMILQRVCALPISEAEDKGVIEASHLYIAPSDYHLLIERGWFALCTEAPVNYARPSIDVLFESAADAYGKSVVGVILTGATEDGARGAAKIRQQGGLMIAQEPMTAQAAAMPAAAIAAAHIDHVLPLSEISSFLVKLDGMNGIVPNGRN